MQPSYSESNAYTSTDETSGLGRNDEHIANDVVIPSDSILKSVTRSIECAVCLERLRIVDNRVLPCQHTYHLGCLQLTLAREGELRCPECRRLSDVDLEDLLPNYTLNKILESLPLDEQNTTDIKAQYQRTRSLNASSLVQQNHQLNNTRLGEHISPLCRALYDYKAQHKTDLSLKKGDLIILLRQLDEHWYLGEVGNSRGTFPVNYVRVINPLARPLCKALFNFEEKHVGEIGAHNSASTNACLCFSKNEVIDLTERVDQSWAKGKIGSIVGIFPLNFVVVNGAARELLNKWCEENRRMDISIDSSKPVLPNSWYYCTIPSAAAERASTLNRLSYWAPSSVRKSRGKSMTSHSMILSQPDEEGTDCASGSSLTPTTYQSFSSILASQHQHTDRISSCSRFSSLANSKSPHKEMFIAKCNYYARREDELDLQAGKCYVVSQICSDGWYKGTCIETGQSGAFPGNFVFPGNETGNFKTTRQYRRVPTYQKTGRSLSNVERPLIESSNSCKDDSLLALDEKIRKMSLYYPTSEYQDLGNSSHLDPKRWLTLSGYGYQHIGKNDNGMSNNQSQSLPSAQQLQQSPMSKNKRYIATLPYPPQNDTEVELVCGDIINVHKQDPDGWLTGTVERSGKTGLLPVSFVQELKQEESSHQNSSASISTMSYSTCM